MSNVSALMQRIQAQKAKVSRQDTTKVGPGSNRYRILPPWGSDGRAWIEFAQHFVKDPQTRKVKAVVVCPDKTFGKPCEVCKMIGQAIDLATNDADIALLKDMQSGGRILFNAIVRDGKSDETQPVILEVPPSVLNGKKGAGGLLDLADQWGEKIFSADGDGMDIIITKNGTGKEGTSYGVQVAAASKPVDPIVLTRLHDLDKYANAAHDEAMRRALSQLSSGFPALGYTPTTPGVTYNPNDEPSTPAPATAFAPANNVVTMPAQPAAVIDQVQDEALRAIEQASVAATVTPTPAPAAPVITPAANQGDADLDELLSGI